MPETPQSPAEPQPAESRKASPEEIEAINHRLENFSDTLAETAQDHELVEQEAEQRLLDILTTHEADDIEAQKQAARRLLRDMQEKPTDD